MILRFLASFGVGFTTGRVTLVDEVLAVFGVALADFAAVRAALASARALVRAVLASALAVFGATRAVLAACFLAALAFSSLAKMRAR